MTDDTEQLDLLNSDELEGGGGHADGGFSCRSGGKTRSGQAEGGGEQEN